MAVSRFCLEFGPLASVRGGSLKHSARTADAHLEGRYRWLGRLPDLRRVSMLPELSLHQGSSPGPPTPFMVGSRGAQRSSQSWSSGRQVHRGHPLPNRGYVVVSCSMIREALWFLVTGRAYISSRSCWRRDQFAAETPAAAPAANRPRPARHRPTSCPRPLTRRVRFRRHPDRPVTRPPSRHDLQAAHHRPERVRQARRWPHSRGRPRCRGYQGVTAAPRRTRTV
jgi:hypothetical protein